jgi:hypothetical protein
MEARLNRVRNFTLLAGVAVAFGLVGIAVAPHSSGNLPSPEMPLPGTCADLARDVDPAKVPIDSGYDPETDIVYAHFEGRTYVLRSDDPSCSALAPARSVRAHAIEVHHQNMEVACASVRRELASGQTRYRGRPFNRQSAQEFIVRDCGAARP